MCSFHCKQATLLGPLWAVGLGVHPWGPVRTLQERFQDRVTLYSPHGGCSVGWTLGR